jgi:hypothetical protein
MIKVQGKEKYMEGGSKHVIKKEFDYLLFRQDWGGSESVYFNADEVKKVEKQIVSGKILIHSNYSVIYCKNKKLLATAPQWCYAVTLGRHK